MNDNELKIHQRVQKPHSETYTYWRVMDFYERFEQVIALLLSFIIATVIIFALWRLAKEVFLMLVLNAKNPLDFEIFQGIFGMIMTLLIAMEFKHSIIKVVHRKVHIIQVKTVLMIAQLALARKFIILDFKTTSALEVFSLGFAVLVLAVAYWLLLKDDDDLDSQKPTVTSEESR